MSVTTKPRTIIVCTPAGSGSSWSPEGGTNWLSHTAVGNHLVGMATPSPRFPVRHRKLIGWVTRWTTRHLVAAERRYGVVRHAAGGRHSRLDLKSVQHGAWYQATYRWTMWRQVTGGQPKAHPWVEYLRRHQADPNKVSLEDARAKFLAQPMIAAMLAHNANPANHRWELDPYEVDAYQAGSTAYATKQMLAALCGDAMLTIDGQWLEPDSDSFADTCTYLKQAARHIRDLSRRAMVVAVTS